MLQIHIDDLMQWVEEQFGEKYSDKLETIKHWFIIFFNLSNQIITLYSSIKNKIQKHSQKQDYKELNITLNHSILLLSKLVETHPKCIDYSFCEKFIKAFDSNLNILCTYYHSLQHFSLVNEEAKFERQKIVEGINKLYAAQNKIKEIFRSNSNVSRILAMINENKKILSSKIQTIKRKTKECKEKQLFLENFEPMIVEFYEQYMQHHKEIEPKQDYKKTLIKMYFQLKHQLFSTQLALENLCKLPLEICEEAKEKKKNQSNLLQENCNTFSRWLGILLKPNYSMKNFKKIKVEEITKSITIIVKEYPHTNNYLVELAQKNLEEVQNLCNLIIEIVKELQKIEHSGVISSINEYKEGLLTTHSKKYICKIMEYQTAMAKYYSLQEEVKKLKNLAQSIVLQEIGLKIDIVLDQH